MHGGNARDILPIDKRTEIDFHHVAALPAGRGFLLGIHRLKGPDTIAALVSGKRTTVLQLPGEAVHSAVYSPGGYLLFERETTIPGIWAVRFAIDRLATDGAPFLVVPGAKIPTLASDGTLAFVRRWPGASQLVRVDRKGSLEPIGDLHGQVGGGSEPVMALSPDGRRLALSIDNHAGAELWSYDLSRGTSTRLTPVPRGSRAQSGRRTATGSSSEHSGAVACGTCIRFQVMKRGSPCACCRNQLWPSGLVPSRQTGGG